jgi:hypothetical protein
MLRYLHAAFWARLPVPGLGQLPINAACCTAAVALGLLAHPGFALVGLGLETAWLAALVSSRRFRAVVDAPRLAGRQDDASAARAALVAALSPSERTRLARLEERALRAVELLRAGGAEIWELDGRRQALDRLLWPFLKLLTAAGHLHRQDAETDLAALQRQEVALSEALADPALPPAARDSKMATRALVQRRLANAARRSAVLAEIAADLDRIEQHIDLAVEEAALPGGRSALALEVQLASHDLAGEDFGRAEAAVASLDLHYLHNVAPSAAPVAVSN